MFLGHTAACTREGRHEGLAEDFPPGSSDKAVLEVHDRPETEDFVQARSAPVPQPTLEGRGHLSGQVCPRYGPLAVHHSEGRTVLDVGVQVHGATGVPAPAGQVFRTALAAVPQTLLADLAGNAFEVHLLETPDAYSKEYRYGKKTGTFQKSPIARHSTATLK